MADKLGLTSDQRNEIRGLHTAYAEKFKAQWDRLRGAVPGRACGPGGNPHPRVCEKAKDYVEDHSL